MKYALNETFIHGSRLATVIALTPTNCISRNRKFRSWRVDFTAGDVTSWRMIQRSINVPATGIIQYP